MSSAVLLGGFAVLSVLQGLLLWRLASIPNDLRHALERNQHQRTATEQAETERSLRRRLRRLSRWVERHHQQLGTEVRAELARVALQRTADAAKVTEASRILDDVRELHAAARSIVIDLRTFAEQQRPQTLRVPERRPPPVPRAPSPPPSDAAHALELGKERG
jgi:hypothetical protein